MKLPLRTLHKTSIKRWIEGVRAAARAVVLRLRGGLLADLRGLGAGGCGARSARAGAALHTHTHAHGSGRYGGRTEGEADEGGDEEERAHRGGKVE